MSIGWKRYYVPVLALTLLEGGAVWTAVTAERGYVLLASLSLHCLASYLALAAAKSRRAGTLSEVEQDVVLFGSLFVPLFGPVIGWTIPRVVADDDIEDAHQVFERYEEHVRPQVPDWERSLFTGDFDRDLARELDAESYYEVLRLGNTDQKRNALARLAELGQPKHLELVRRCLEDPVQEVTLYAYSELERLGKSYEEKIETLTLASEKNPTDAAVLYELADAYYAYAFSGVLDGGLSAYHFRICMASVKGARENGDTRVETYVLEALSLVGLGETPAARELLDSLPENLASDTRVRLVRARIAFEDREFDEARAEANAIVESGDDLPAWLQAIHAASTDEADAAADAAGEDATQDDKDERDLEAQKPLNALAREISDLSELDDWSQPDEDIAAIETLAREADLDRFPAPEVELHPDWDEDPVLADPETWTGDESDLSVDTPLESLRPEPAQPEPSGAGDEMSASTSTDADLATLADLGTPVSHETAAPPEPINTEAHVASGDETEEPAFESNNTISDLAN
ncbi:MAG: hypothetical protein V3T86_02245, partial [Planctomycetota bacterium]